MNKIYSNKLTCLKCLVKLPGKHLMLLAILLPAALPAFSQPRNNVMTAPDSTFTMKVSREKGEILIALSFADDFNFDFVAVERKPDFDPSFSQCKYIDYQEVIKKERHLVKKDNYPFPASSDVLYRLKVVAKDGSERTYSPILLPSVQR